LPNTAPNLGQNFPLGRATRKYGLFLGFCHQSIGQLPERLITGLGNVKVVVAFGVSKDDADYFARLFTKVDAKTVRHDHREEHLSESVGMREQEAAVSQELYDQWQRPHWLMRQLFHPSPRKLVHVRTPTVRYPTLRPGELEAVEAEYLRRTFRPASAALTFDTVWRGMGSPRDRPGNGHHERPKRRRSGTRRRSAPPEGQETRL
jgi:hypothetical protein